MSVRVLHLLTYLFSKNNQPNKFLVTQKLKIVETCDGGFPGIFHIFCGEYTSIISKLCRTRFNILFIMIFILLIEASKPIYDLFSCLQWWKKCGIVKNITCIVHLWVNTLTKNHEKKHTILSLHSFIYTWNAYTKQLISHTKCHLHKNGILGFTCTSSSCNQWKWIKFGAKLPHHKDNSSGWVKGPKYCGQNVDHLIIFSWASKRK